MKSGCLSQLRPLSYSHFSFVVTSLDSLRPFDEFINAKILYRAQIKDFDIVRKCFGAVSCGLELVAWKIIAVTAVVNIILAGTHKRFAVTPIDRACTV